MKQPLEDTFTTFYFETGFETLINVAEYVESMSGIEVSVGSDFINVYTEAPAKVAFCREVIEAYTLEYPHVRLSVKEHGAT